ncbi:MAG: SDR family oxidoreductase [Thermosynechococcaceae cyanobacterium]
MMQRKKLLITGASGYLGWHLGQAAQNAWDVYGLTGTKRVQDPAIQNVRVDLTHEIALQAALHQIQPDALIHAAALSRPNTCEVDPDLSFAVNVQAAWQIADYCAERDIPCVFTSTDQVFDGQKAPYGETDPVAPINRYGEHKVLAEEGMRSRYPHTIICRLPLLYGLAPQGKTFLQGFVSQLRAGEPLKAFTDEIRTPVSGQSAAQGILLALSAHQPYLHLGGRERLSRYAFACMLADALGLPANLIQPCHQADVPMAAPRPQDVSLDSALAQSLGYKPLTVQADLGAMLHQNLDD